MDLSNLWPLAILQTIVNAVTKTAQAVAIIIALVLWVNRIIETCLVSTFRTMFDLLNTVDTSFVSNKNASFAAIEYIGYVNAFLPVSEFVGMLFLYLTAWSVVITIRWIKSLVPTCSN